MWRVVITVVVVLARTAAADPAADAYARGEELYKATKYSEAALAFEQAYSLDQDPATLFNIAQSYRFANNCAKAADYYRQYLAKANAPNADKVREYIADQERCAKEHELVPRPTVGPNKPQTPKAPVQPPRDQVTSDDGHGRRRLGLVVGAAGLVAVGVGGYFTLRVRNLNDQRKTQQAGCSVEDPCAPDPLNTVDDRGHRAQLGEAIAYPLGVAAIATGVTLYIMGRRGHESPVAVTPLPGGAFAVGTVRF